MQGRLSFFKFSRSKGAQIFVCIITVKQHLCLGLVTGYLRSTTTISSGLDWERSLKWVGVSSLTLITNSFTIVYWNVRSSKYMHAAHVFASVLVGCFARSLPLAASSVRFRLPTPSSQQYQLLRSYLAPENVLAAVNSSGALYLYLVRGWTSDLHSASAKNMMDIFSVHRKVHKGPLTRYLQAGRRTA